MEANSCQSPFRKDASSPNRKSPAPEGRSNPVSNLSVPELYVDVSERDVAERVTAGADCPTGVGLVGPSFMPCFDPTPSLLRVEAPQMPSLDVGIEERVDDRSDISLSPPAKRNSFVPGQGSAVSAWRCCLVGQREERDVAQADHPMINQWNPMRADVSCARCCCRSWSPT
jgi:hypothetical protein